MNEEAIKSEMRIYVLETFIANLFAMYALQAAPAAPSDAFEKAREQILEGARKQTFPQVDPAMSDLLSAELEAAATRLAAMVSAQIAVVVRSR